MKYLIWLKLKKYCAIPWWQLQSLSKMWEFHYSIPDNSIVKLLSFLIISVFYLFLFSRISQRRQVQFHQQDYPSRCGGAALCLHNQVPVCGSHGLQVSALAGRLSHSEYRLLCLFQSCGSGFIGSSISSESGYGFRSRYGPGSIPDPLMTKTVEKIYSRIKNIYFW